MITAPLDRIIIMGLSFEIHFPPIYYLKTLNFSCGLPTIRYFSILAIIIPLHPDKSLYKDSKTFCTPLLAESSSCEQYIRHNNYVYVPLQGISVRKYKYMGI